MHQIRHSKQEMSIAWIALLPNKKQKIWKKQHYLMIFDYARAITAHNFFCIPAVADGWHCRVPIFWGTIMISHTSNKLISQACILFKIAQEITRLNFESRCDAGSGQRYTRTKRDRKRTACRGGIYNSSKRTTSKMGRRSEKWGNRNIIEWSTRRPLDAS